MIGIVAITRLVSVSITLTLRPLPFADPETLESRTGRAQRGDLVAIAAVLGKTRLIDNVLLPK